MIILRKIDAGLAAAEKIIAVALFAALAGSIVINIVARNLFQTSFQFLLEIGPALVLWLALVGSTLALRENRHIRIELVLRFCPRWFVRLAERLCALFGMAIMALLGYSSFEFVANEVAIFGTKGWLAAVFPLFFALAFFRFFTRVAAPDDNPGQRVSAGAMQP